jgi:hypothetical protein
VVEDNQALAEHHRAAVHIVSERMVEVAGVAVPIEVAHKAVAVVHILAAVVVASSPVVLHRVVAVVDQDHYTCVQASLKTEHPLYT